MGVSRMTNLITPSSTLRTAISGVTPLVMVLALLFLTCGMLPSARAAEKTTAAAQHLLYERERLTIRTELTPLVELVQEIAATAGLGIITATPMYGDQLVSADIEAAPLVKTLAGLLDGCNYLIFFSANGPSRGLHLLSGTSVAPAGEKLLVLTGRGAGLRMVKSGFSPAAAKPVRAAATSADASAAGAALPPLSLRSSPGQPLKRRTPDSGPAKGGISSGPLTFRKKKGEKSDMPNRETFHQPAGAIEKKLSLSGRDSVWDGEAGDGMADSLADAAGNVAETAEPFDFSFAREDYLRYQIDKLTERIESGDSDRHYEFWAQKKDPKYITSDRDLLARYEQELRTLVEKE
jgi:hypothetical protein